MPLNTRTIMRMAMAANLVCRDRMVQGQLKLWLAKPGASRGFLVSPEDAPSFIAHGERLYDVAMRQGLTPVR